MILGLLAGGVLRSERTPQQKISWLVVAGALSMAAGWALGITGICPVVKRIWTPSWVLFSGGWCFWLLAAWYAVIDVAGWKAWAFPLIVIGMNSIAAYCMTHGSFEHFVSDNLKTHLGSKAFEVFGATYQPLVHGFAVMLVSWLILLWMYRRRIFLRI
jgi:predicted acyltransferase